MIRKTGLIAVAMMLAACSVVPDRREAVSRSAGPADDAALRLSHFAFSDASLASHEATPLGADDWIFRRGEATVPIFASSTPKEKVLDTLREWRLKPAVVDDSIIVREGPSRHRFGVTGPDHVIYGFQQGLLVVGPLKEHELVDVLIYWGLGSGDFALLAALDLVAPLSAESLNNVAWAFATYHDASRRAPAVALIMADRANALSNWQNPAHLDTLAAAFAAAGNFDSAASFQLEAVLMSDGDDPSMLDRLALYEQGQPYVEAADAAALAGIEAPPDGLLERAAAGEAAAQFELAVYCLKNGLEPCAGEAVNGGHWLLKSARQGYLEAVEEVAFGFLHGYYGFARSPETAYKWFQKAVALDSWLADYHLATMYRDKFYLERDEREVTRLLRSAAAQGMPEAAIEAAFRLREGVGAKPDAEEASRLFAVASDAGVGPEQILYGSPTAYSAELVNDDAIAALPKLDILPEQFPAYLMRLVDGIEKQLQMGQGYVSARFPDRLTGWLKDDAPEVVYVLTRAAARFGSVTGQRKLAQLYERGDGVEQSAEEAAYWRQRALNNASKP